MADGADFNPSKLGTKDHWEHEYTRELDNFREIGDEGEVWFGYHVQTKVVDW
jgi:hypothetical protein